MCISMPSCARQMIFFYVIESVKKNIKLLIKYYIKYNIQIQHIIIIDWIYFVQIFVIYNK